MSFGYKWISPLIIVSLTLLISSPTAKAGIDTYSPATNYDQLNALMKEYLKILDKVKSQPTQQQLSGQLNLRPPRSELVGDMAHALRLYQLAELDRMYGAKSRPRFGKRTQEYAPGYGIALESPFSTAVMAERERVDDPRFSGDEQTR